MLAGQPYSTYAFLVHYAAPPKGSDGSKVATIGPPHFEQCLKECIPPSICFPHAGCSYLADAVDANIKYEKSDNLTHISVHSTRAGQHELSVRLVQQHANGMEVSPPVWPPGDPWMQPLKIQVQVFANRCERIVIVDRDPRIL